MSSNRPKYRYDLLIQTPSGSRWESVLADSMTESGRGTWLRFQRGEELVGTAKVATLLLWKREEVSGD